MRCRIASCPTCRVLARVFAGRPGDRLYVTLFAEFQTYPCKDNAWSPDAATTAYYEKLKDQYRSALAIFHTEAPNALVSLGWGGWQASYDTPAIGGGRSLFKHFADVMQASGFQSFQSLESPTAVRDAKAMTRALRPYGPVMLAFYKPLGPSPSAVETRIRSFLSASNLKTLRTDGLFALSFMDTTFLRDRSVLGRHGGGGDAVCVRSLSRSLTARLWPNRSSGLSAECYVPALPLGSGSDGERDRRSRRGRGR